jgi:hypothetical protein
MYQPQLQRVRLSGPSHPSQLTGTEKQLKPPKLSLSFRMVFSWWKVEANYDHELRTKALETGTRIGKGTLYKAVDGEEVHVEQQHPDVGRVPRRHQPRREQPSAGRRLGRGGGHRERGVVGVVLLVPHPRRRS